MLSTPKIFSLLFCFLFFTSEIRLSIADRCYFNDSFSIHQVDSVVKVFINFNDTIPNDTLYFCFSKGDPKAVYREITTGVCLDRECRPVRITLYWTLTGRYLGYRLDKQELTKKEHTPFTETEYRLLHSLLSDSLSGLANFTLAEIQPKKEQRIKTDGITGATPPNIGPYIVPEAAYTTYTLWHLVYGETRDSINQKVRSYLTFGVLDSLLKSSWAYDQSWSLSHLPKNFNFNQYLPGLLHILKSTHPQTIEGALSVIGKNSDSIYQESLFSLVGKDVYTVRKVAFDRIGRLDKIRPEMARKMIDCLPNAEPTLANVFLMALEKYNPSEEDRRKISILIDSSNAQVSLNAYLFLSRLPQKSKWLLKRIKKFEKQKLKI